MYGLTVTLKDLIHFVGAQAAFDCALNVLASFPSSPRLLVGLNPPQPSIDCSNFSHDGLKLPASFSPRYSA